MMQTAHIHLIKYTLSKGCTISVWDGAEWQVSKSASYKAIKDAIDSVEESELRIRDSDNKVVGWAHILDQGQPDETVVDFTCTPFMKEWDDIFMAL